MFPPAKEVRVLSTYRLLIVFRFVTSQKEMDTAAAFGPAIWIPSIAGHNLTLLVNNFGRVFVLRFSNFSPNNFEN